MTYKVLATSIAAALAFSACGSSDNSTPAASDPTKVTSGEMRSKLQAYPDCNRSLPVTIVTSNPVSLSGTSSIIGNTVFGRISCTTYSGDEYEGALGWGLVLSPSASNETLYVDTDNDSATGMYIGGIGADLKRQVTTDYGWNASTQEWDAITTEPVSGYYLHDGGYGQKIWNIGGSQEDNASKNLFSTSQQAIITYTYQGSSASTQVFTVTPF